MSGRRIVVIGGSAAGPKAAAKARRLDQDAQITIVQREAELSMASCGYPYYVGGLFAERLQLIATPTGAPRDAAFYQNAKGITALVKTEALAIDRAAKMVRCRRLESGEELALEYDQLILATGARAIVPPLPGADLAGVTTFTTLRDADYLRQICDAGQAKHAVIVGGGLIGMETCEALRKRGLTVTVVERLPQILTYLDPELAKLVENHARSQGAAILTNRTVEAFVGESGKLTGVRLDGGEVLPAEVAVLAVGVRPETALAKAAGLPCGATGGVTVDQEMRTADPNIFAVGDCCEIPHLLTGQPVFAPFGDLANLEGRVAAQNAVRGGGATFPGTIQTGVCQVFAFTAGATGLSETAARKAGLTDFETVVTAMPEKPGFMGAKPLICKMLAERSSGRLLGFQCIGPGDASKRVAVAATAIQGQLTVSDLVNLDLPYAPPYSAAIDAFITTAHVLENKLAGLMTGISAAELNRRLSAGEKPFLLDVRGPDEFAEMKLGRGEVLIPLGKLRARLNELPADRNAEIICYCKISLRGYEAATFLSQRGYTNVKVLEGGLVAWPFGTTK